MDVRLDEAGKKVSAARVDDLIVPAVGLGSDRDDAAVADHHRAVDDVEAIVHRDDGGVPNQRRRHGVSESDAGFDDSGIQG